MAASCVNQRRCQATGKLLFSLHTGQLGARIPSLLVRCHKPFIGCTAANLKNTSIKARRPPASPGPKEGFKEGRGEEESGLGGGLGRRSLPVPSLHSLWGRVSLLGACFSSWGVPWISTFSPRPERRGSCPPWTIPTLFLLGVFLETEAAGKSPHVGSGNSSDRQLPRSGAPVSPPGLAPAPRSPPRTAESLARREPCGRLQDRLGRASPPRVPQSRFGAGPSAELTHLAGAGRGGSGAPLPFSGSRQTFAGAQRASLGGPARDARARRGEPGAAGGGGRPRVRAAGARGSRRGMGPAASSRRAARPPAGPAALSAPSRLPLASAAARRAGARRAARNCFHCKQKKATHDQAGGGEARGGRGAKGRDGAQGAEGAGERENVGRAAGGLGRRVRTRRDQPCPLPPHSDRPLAWALPGRSRETRPGWAAWIRLPRHRGAWVAGSGFHDLGQPRPWAAWLAGPEAHGLSLPRAQATRAGRLCAAGYVSPERYYPIRIPYMARK